MLDTLSEPSLLNLLPLVLLAAMGLTIGSYLNVAIYRIPAGLSTVYPGSRCPRCLLPIRPYDNVPVLGWLWLGARCRDCGGSIACRYPLVEAGTAGLFLLSYRRFPEQPGHMAVGCMLAAVTLVLAMIDWDRRLVPLDLVVAAAIVGPIAQNWLRWTPAVVALGTALVAGVGLALASELWRRLAGAPGFAVGDVAVLSMIGAWLGPRATLLTLTLAAAAVIPYCAVVRRRGRSTRRSEAVPFVTFLCFAMQAVLFLLPVDF